MEVSIGIALACAVIATWGWMALNWVWLKPKRLERVLRQQRLHGNSYRFLYGDTKDITAMLYRVISKPLPEFTHDYSHRIVPFVKHTLDTYGRISFIWSGPTLTVYIMEAELMREVFMKMNDFQKQMSNPLLHLLAPGLVRYEGDKWAKHRKLISPAFNLDKLKLMLPAFYESCSEMVTKWEKMVGVKGSQEIEVWSYVHNLAADVISRAAFGSCFEDGKRIFELIREQLEVAIPLIHSVYIPGWRFMPTKRNKKIIATSDEIEALINDIINKRKKAMEGGDPANNDLLGILLESAGFRDMQSSGESKSQMGNMKLTFTEVVEECKLFYMAGQETTSCLLVWALICLSKHTDWQDRARQEVLATFGCNKPDFDGLGHLKIVNMIVHEVLRLYPPVIQLTRRVHRDTRIGNIFLPADVLVSLPVLLVHHDTQHWGKDANEFNPERFAEGVSKATGGNMSFFSFGWGPKICLGSNFAIIEVKMALALILQRFSLSLSPSYAHAPIALTTLQPQFGAPIILNQV